MGRAVGFTIIILLIWFVLAPTSLGVAFYKLTHGGNNPPPAPTYLENTQ